MKKQSYASQQQPVRPVSDQAKAAQEAHDTAFGEPQVVASTTECTGLSPAMVPDEQVADNYAQLYSVHVQLPAKGRNVTTGGAEKH